MRYETRMIDGNGNFVGSFESNSFKDCLRVVELEINTFKNPSKIHVVLIYDWSEVVVRRWVK